jgi:L-amino acid N-acyltransferase YncA
MEIEPILNCNQADYLQILTDIEDFWGSNRTLHFHHPMFVNDANTSFVIKQDDKVIAYLMGFISQTENIGYVHLIGVRASNQRQGLGEKLYRHFVTVLRQKGISGLKAITTPTNIKSLNFHLKLGMEMTGEILSNGIKVIQNYSGVGQDRVVFLMKI